MRGGSSGPNYDAESLATLGASLGRAGLPDRVMVDCSHANSGKDHARQPEVAGGVAAQVAEGNRSIMGVMLESFLEDGRQDVKPGAELTYGQSITDACMSWQRTLPVFDEFAAAVRARREKAL